MAQFRGCSKEQLAETASDCGTWTIISPMRACAIRLIALSLCPPTSSLAQVPVKTPFKPHMGASIRPIPHRRHAPSPSQQARAGDSVRALAAFTKEHRWSIVVG